MPWISSTSMERFRRARKRAPEGSSSPASKQCSRRANKRACDGSVFSSGLERTRRAKKRAADGTVLSCGPERDLASKERAPDVLVLSCGQGRTGEQRSVHPMGLSSPAKLDSWSARKPAPDGFVFSCEARLPASKEACTRWVRLLRRSQGQQRSVYPIGLSFPRTDKTPVSNEACPHCEQVRPQGATQCDLAFSCLSSKHHLRRASRRAFDRALSPSLWVS